MAYQYNLRDSMGPGGTVDTMEINRTASAANNYDGCHPDQGLPCHKSARMCGVTAQFSYPNNPNKPVRIHLNATGIPDHNSWSFGDLSYIGTQSNFQIRVPAYPTLLSEEAAIMQGAGMGAIGMAINGVAIYTPYNKECCDVAFKELKTMDYCLAHPASGQYHYHMFSWSDTYDGCLMSCKQGEESGLVGVAYDGFPIYGPMQNYSPSMKKVFLDGCADCELTQLSSEHTDVCGGVEVADDPSMYRYIATNTFPYTLQCFRGDMSSTQKFKTNSLSWVPFTFGNTCGVGSTGDDSEGGTWDVSEGGYRNGTCHMLNETTIDSLGCTPGNCDFKPWASQFLRAKDHRLSDVYYQCAAPETTSSPTTTAGNSTSSTTTAGSSMTTTGASSATTAATAATTAATAATATTATTSAAPTTTTTAFDPAVMCPDKGTLVKWKGAKGLAKLLFFGADIAIIRTNVPYKEAFNLMTGPYLGFMGFPKKMCGMDAVRAFDDGRLSWGIVDNG